MQASYRKKLIEVALPLDAINKESAREKSIRHGHPSTLHLWWARRPLAACRAVLFSSLVNDPGDDPMYGLSEDIAATERAKLFDLIEELVKWENSNNPRVINAARLEIARSIAANKAADGELEDDTLLVAGAPALPEEQAKYLPDPPPEYTPHEVRFKMPGLKSEQMNHFLAHYAPPVLDPFAGGGSIPLEAQRLGLRAYASDLNPVPVLINKAMIEIPPKFVNMPPVNPEWQSKSDEEKAITTWKGAQGLAEDVRHYGKWMRDEAEKRIGHLYPKVKVTEEMAADRPDLEPYVGQELTVIAWLWAKTVACANPACKRYTPLLATYVLSSKAGKNRFVIPQEETNAPTFIVRDAFPDGLGDAKKGLKRGTSGIFECMYCGSVTTRNYVAEEGVAGRISSVPTAIVAQGHRERVYLEVDESTILSPAFKIDDKDISVAFSPNPREVWCRNFGISTPKELFTDRQLATLTTFADLVDVAYEKIRSDACNEQEYAKAIATFLGIGVSRTVNSNCTTCIWSTSRDQSINSFGRQVIPMTWDFPEVNPLAGAAGDLSQAFKSIGRIIENLAGGDVVGNVRQAKAQDRLIGTKCVCSTDPPYYDNIGYSDLSDFFYCWLRRGLKTVYPQLFSTIVTPKEDELVAFRYRHGDHAKEFFEENLRTTLTTISSQSYSDAPATIYYAFKQTEVDDQGQASTGWETFLSALIDSGFAITGTWPLRTERERGLKSSLNALASSVLSVCRVRDTDSPTIARRDFVSTLRKELPKAIKHMQSGNVAPVDLAQATIGPGMAVFSRYDKVLESDGSPMRVRTALALINQVLDEALAEQEGEFDAETRWALAWFDQYGNEVATFGDAETLCKAKGVAVDGLVDAGILEAKSGKVRLLHRDALPEEWDPMTDSRLVVWEVIQYLIRTLENDGETATAELLRKVGSLGEIARDLAYRLYTTC